MRFDVRYPDGTHHTVETSRPLTVVGRDPSCDLVLSHPRVSRRHAVIEQSPAGLFVRDMHSSHGVFLNGRRVERAALAAGDELRLGEVVLEALDESQADTRLTLTPEPPPPSIPQEASATQPPLHDDASRPLTLTLLATAWLVALPLTLAGAVSLALARPLAGVGAWLVPLLLAASALAAAVLGFGILGRRGWLPAAHLVVCALAALTCVLAPFAGVAALYFLHPRIRAHFGAGANDPPVGRKPPNEAAYATAVVAALATGVIVLLTFFSGERSLLRLAREQPWSGAGAVVQRMRSLYGAEESFRRICNVGYADMDALRRPASVIPGFPPNGAPFIPQALAAPEAHGYRFELSVTEPMAPTADCPTFRRYRSFRYTARPVSGKGLFYLLQSDGVIRSSDNRPARADDPALEAR